MARVARVADEAVRAYMEAIQDPNTAVDWDHVDDLAAKITESADPVERVLLRSQWRIASDPATYIPDLEADFIAFSGQWAQANSVVGDDFFFEGVPLTILAQAGLEVSETATQYADEEEIEEAEAVAENPQAPAPIEEPAGDSPMERAEAAIGTASFTIPELAERADVSRTVVRQLVERLTAENKLTETGEDSEGEKLYTPVA